MPRRAKKELTCDLAAVYGLQLAIQRALSNSRMLDLSFASASYPPLAGHTLFPILLRAQAGADRLSPSFVLDRAPQNKPRLLSH